MRRFNKPAFTLVELLVVIAIIGILIALLLPAINAARESGRRAQCMNNIKQVGLAAINYQESYGSFPPGVMVAAGQEPWLTTSPGVNWVVKILPFTEYNSLYKMVNLNAPMSDASNAPVRATILPTMLCPSDSFYNSKAYMPVQRKAIGENWARGNYAANGSIEYLYYAPEGGTDTPPSFVGPNSPGWATAWLRGAMGVNEASAMRQITDGAAQTCMLVEVRAGVAPVDARGTWALGAVGSSIVFGHGCSDDHGPNNLSPTADDLVDCAEIQQTIDANTLAQMDMGCDQAGMSIQATSRSTHPDGVNICMCDGSVHFISNEINCSINWHFNPFNVENPADFGVWESLMAAGDGITPPSNAW